MEIADSEPAVTALCKHKDLDIHLRNNLGETALEIFVKNGHATAIKALAKHPKFRVNQRNRWGETALLSAVRLRSVQVARALLTLPGIDVEACDESGLTALDLARRLDHGPLKSLLSPRLDRVNTEWREEMEDMSVALIRHPRSWM
ncbi:ankyrin repeat-containing domain protein [Aspergillus pseudoustus]|uniref:Ankyrin repeat-containing domain protein n=1 Tax=Aspergillus pseudoustus TaxID=1810923 RepID=A0ABR4J0T3_9EURO